MSTLSKRGTNVVAPHKKLRILPVKRPVKTMDDCVRLVLHHACHLRIKHNSRTVHGSLAWGSIAERAFRAERRRYEVFNIKKQPLVVCNGMIGRKETILFSYEIQPHEGVVAVRSSELEKTTSTEFELCLQDTIGDDGEEYEDARLKDHEMMLPRRFRRFPCLGWGRPRRLTYTIALSRFVSTTVAFDVVVVPTSWWVNDCEGDYWVVQMTEGFPLQIDDVHRVEGYSIAGWKRDATNGAPWLAW